MHRFKNKAKLRAALDKAGVKSKAELERRLKSRMGKRAPSRQYLSRILADDGDPTTSQETARGIAAVVGQPVDKFFEAPVKTGSGVG